MENRGPPNLAENSNAVDFAASSVSRRLLSIPSNSKTFVPMTIEELSLVQDLSMWTSTNVRCIGTLIDLNNSIMLQSCAEAAGKYEINVNISLMEKEPPLNTVIQLFGEICVDEHAVPFIKGCFYRNFESVDLVMYNQALDMISSFFPLNIKRNAKKPRCEGKGEEEVNVLDR